MCTFHSFLSFFQVSRAILAAASARFWAMFTDERTVEAKSGIISMDHWDPPLVHSMLLFIYGAPMPEWTVKEAERLLPLALEFQVEGLIVSVRPLCRPTSSTVIFRPNARRWS